MLELWSKFAFKISDIKHVEKIQSPKLNALTRIAFSMDQNKSNSHESL